MYLPEKLARAGYDLGIEVHEGKWDHLPGMKTTPAPACSELIDEFKRRCPGYTFEDYQHALAEGLNSSR